ncbi:hypothetical protein V1477_017765 [Vespula maculifrons]|uniref:Uncharacterized protein n=1 Tax=Vespula maculifrons TaxID=7453 RepID=A0ABD2B0E2_VESMC
MEQRKKNLSVTIFFSETVAHTKAAPRSLERALRALHAHHLGKPDRGHWKAIFAAYTAIFFLSRSEQ